MTREFVILPEFEKCWSNIGLTDEDLRELENYLCLHSEIGAIVPNTGGLRKLRWSAQGKGKQGGVRVIYVDFAYHGKLCLISVYPKSVKINLTEVEKSEIRKLIKILLHELKKK